jgi:hypothetical protein
VRDGGNHATLVTLSSGAGSAKEKGMNQRAMVSRDFEHDFGVSFRLKEVASKRWVERRDEYAR